MAAVLLAGGAKGKRAVLPNSRVLIHQPWVSGLGGQQTDIEIHARDLLPHARAPRRDPRLPHRQDRRRRSTSTPSATSILAAEEAVEYGLVDQVMARAEPVERYDGLEMRHG